MAKRKLSESKSLDETVAQAFDRRTTLGRNIHFLSRRFKKTRNSKGTSLLRVLASNVRKKGIRNFGGEIDIRIGQLRKGRKLAKPKPGELHERIGVSPSSGQELVRVYPVSYTLNKDGEALARAGYTTGTRLEFEDIVGPVHKDTLVLYRGLLNDPNLPKKLGEQAKAGERRKAANKKLSDTAARIPKYFMQLLEKHGIDASALDKKEILKAGPELAEEHWTALLWALDPGKNRTIINWFRKKQKADDLPLDVLEAWLYLNEFPHLATEEHIRLLGQYQLQIKPEKRDGIAGDIPEELRWLEKNQGRKKVKKLYRRKANLSAKHRPARFYKGEVPNQGLTVKEFLAEPYWTIADKEGILRKYPLSKFRQKWNRQLIAAYFGKTKEFYRSMQGLYEIVLADFEKIKQAGGHKKADTKLGNDYAFAKETLESLTKDLELSDSFDIDSIAGRISIHRSEDRIKRLYLLSQKVRLYNAFPERPGADEIFRQKFCLTADFNEITGLGELSEVMGKLEKSYAENDKTWQKYHSQLGRIKEHAAYGIVSQQDIDAVRHLEKKARKFTKADSKGGYILQVQEAARSRLVAEIPFVKDREQFAKASYLGPDVIKKLSKKMPGTQQPIAAAAAHEYSAARHSLKNNNLTEERLLAEQRKTEKKFAGADILIADPFHLQIIPSDFKPENLLEGRAIRYVSAYKISWYSGAQRLHDFIAGKKTGRPLDSIMMDRLRQKLAQDTEASPLYVLKR